jgi:hypothetical protein
LVERGRLRSLVFACPDGCGTTLTINLDDRAGPAWRLYSDEKGLSLYPSVWRDNGCESHFILWHDKIVWCGRMVEGSEEPDFDLVDKEMILGALDGVFRPATDVAGRIGAIPWEVSRVCERLARGGDIEAFTADDRRRLFRLRPLRSPARSTDAAYRGPGPRSRAP